MTDLTLTVCLGFRNWHVDHLTRCLDSLRRMAPVPGVRVDIVLVTTGAAPADVAERATVMSPYADTRILDACHRTKTLLVRDPQPEWSRSYALNRASAYARASSEYLVFTDADMLFPSHWLAAAAAHVTPRTLWLTDSRDLNEVSTALVAATLSERERGTYVQAASSDDPAFGVDQYVDSVLYASSTPHDRVGQGAAMVVPKSWFREVRGFEEQYKVWGCEDNDLVFRAQWAGLTVDWLPNTYVAHQWHRRDWPTEAQYQQVGVNRRLLQWKLTAHAAHGTGLDANPTGWAGAYDRLTPMKETV